jgi:hypothetical protein
MFHHYSYIFPYDAHNTIAVLVSEKLETMVSRIFGLPKQHLDLKDR